MLDFPTAQVKGHSSMFAVKDPAGRDRWRRSALALCAPALASILLDSPISGAVSPAVVRRPSLILLTLDTTRSDHVGPQPGKASLTPHLDALGGRGLRYAKALSPAPLTLPAHCTLLTGLDPPAHRVRDNGTTALGTGVPTLASVLARHGYATAAFVSSRVLDRRFGLDRGFSVYDDRMPAERLGEYGYPERDALAVTNAALAWAEKRPRGRPYFLWVHYYDPHLPYAAPGPPASSPAARYAAEVAYMDVQIGRLLETLSPDGARTVVAAVGDHGEMLGEHGEAAHGIFLYRASLEVPAILAGPGVPRGTVVSETVGTRALPSALLRLLGLPSEAQAFGPPLPGLGLKGAAPAPAVVYSETMLPATAYGWSALQAVSDDRWRFIRAPRPELFDLAADPSEQHNLAGDHPVDRARMERALLGVAGGARGAGVPVKPDAALAESLASLGYHSGASGAREGTIDPKDGIGMLAELDETRAWVREGRAREAAAKLEDLVKRSPGNVPFLVRLAVAQAAAGRPEAGAATLKHAVGLNPRLDFLHAHLADAYLDLGRVAEARAEYELALELNPRFARAWLGLAEAAGRSGTASAERDVLRRAVAAGADSAMVWSRVAELELQGRDMSAAERAAGEATRLMPELPQTWLVRARVAEAAGRNADAVAFYEKAVSLGLVDPQVARRLEQLRGQKGSRP